MLNAYKSSSEEDDDDPRTYDNKRPNFGENIAFGGQRAQDDRLRKSKSKRKKRKEKRKKMSQADVKLPLLEDPVGLESASSEEEDEGENRNMKNALSMKASIWDDTKPEEVEDDEPGRNLDTIEDEFASAAAIAAQAEEGPSESVHDVPSDQPVMKVSDRDLERMIREGRDVSQFMDKAVIAESIRDNARAIKSARDDEQEAKRMRNSSTKMVFAGQRVSASQKRKHQLNALAFEAVQNQEELEEKWARRKKLKQDKKLKLS